MINFIIVLLIVSFVGIALSYISLNIIAFGYVGNFKIASYIVFFTVKESSPSNKEKLVLNTRKHMTDELYKQLERINKKTDLELQKEQGLKVKDVAELRKKVDKILQERPKYLISCEQTRDMLRIFGVYSFFGLFKILVEGCSSPEFSEHVKSDKKEENYIVESKSMAVLKKLPNDNDLIRSLI